MRVDNNSIPLRCFMNHELFQRLCQPLPNPVPNYDGPHEFLSFADFLPFIGEVVLGFARMERWLTWGIESALKIQPQQADAIQESIMSVSTRINLFHTVAKPHAPNEEMEVQLDRLIKRLFDLNDYRNQILHGPWFGTSGSFGADGEIVERAAMKAKYAPLGAKSLESKQRSHTKEELRAKAEAMINAGGAIYEWVCLVFPNCEKRVP